MKQILIFGMFAAAGTVALHAGDTTASSSVDSQIRAAVTIFQDQKAAFLAQQKEFQKTNAKKVRDEVRAQVATAKSTAITPLRQEIRQSIEDAKHQAVEQARKVAAESAEMAREAHH